MPSAAARPRVFLDVTIDDLHVGRLTIELFAEQAPKTCENFRALCTGTKPPLTYTSTPFHRIIPDFMIQGGDTTAANGTGGISIFGPTFPDESLGWRALDAPGLLCMATRGADTNSSQFFITLAPAPHLDAKHTVFGRLVTGLDDVLPRIAAVPVDADDRPTVSVVINRAGEL
ncbi:peptidyl-prolyl cis-trans isomerase H-like protein, partial [Microthyrium microscopicum]